VRTGAAEAAYAFPELFLRLPRPENSE